MGGLAHPCAVSAHRLTNTMGRQDRSESEGLPAVGSDHSTGRLEFHSQRATATAVRPTTPRLIQRARADAGAGAGAGRARLRRSSAGTHRVRNEKLSDAHTGHCGSV